MHILLKAGAIALVPLALAGCNPDTLKTACAAKDALYSDWSNYAAVASISDKTRASVDSAKVAADQICVAPPTDIASALITVSRVGVTIAIARKAAEQEAKAKGKPLPVSLRKAVEWAR